jgi:hypothetical protein
VREVHLGLDLLVRVLVLVEAEERLLEVLDGGEVVRQRDVVGEALRRLVGVLPEQALDVVRVEDVAVRLDAARPDDAAGGQAL